MNIQPDFEEFLRLLEKNRVRYLIVGGYAVAFHGYPRFTRDIDIFFLDSDENITSVIDTLVEFGFDRNRLDRSIFSSKGNVIQFGVEPVRIDLLNQIDGITFEEAEANAVFGHYGSVKVRFIGKTDLIRNKNATSRLKDKADVDELKEQ
jgi:hypothetical protein